MSEAMVKPGPFKPGSLVVLAALLQELGNTRAYTVISVHGNSWKVMFEGDYEPSIVRMVHNKPVINKA